jgi:hypothetical protein
VDPLDQPDPAGIEAGQQVQVPQRAVAGQDLAHQLAGDPSQRGVVTRRRQAQLDHVAGDVEVRVVDPAGPVEVEGHGGQAAAQPGQRIQAGVDAAADLVEAEATGRAEQRPRLERGHGPDVGGGARVLEPDEAGVQGREPVRGDAVRAARRAHVGPPFPRAASSSSEA